MTNQEAIRGPAIDRLLLHLLELTVDGREPDHLQFGWQAWVQVRAAAEMSRFSFEDNPNLSESGTTMFGVAAEMDATLSPMAILIWHGSEILAQFEA